MLLSFLNVSFTHEGGAGPLLAGLTAGFPRGWTGIVGANGAGKTTLLRLACGELQPREGTVHAPETVIYCPQRTDAPPPLLGAFLAAGDGPAFALRGRLHIDPGWGVRWDTLSHGERKRSQIAVALWQDPGLLALDEPTNHIDADARALLAGALAGFRGIGLLVSHDRDLLDSLCGQCLFLEPPAATMRPGGYTAASAQALLEAQHLRRQHELAREALVRIERSVSSRRREAARADRRRSKRGLDPRDHDSREKIDRARVSGKDGQAGRLVRQAEGRIRQARETLGGVPIKKEYDLGIWMPGARSRRDRLFHLPACEIPLGAGRMLAVPDLFMAPDDRVALTGPNGGGKSTLVRRLLSGLDLPEGRLVYVPQEIDLDASRAILVEAAGLAREERGRVMTVVSCLGSRPDRLLSSLEPSPGETRKLLLALGIARTPHLIVMDEPTNHLDLPAIECLEEALAPSPCGLLLVSHDRRFLNRLARTRWRIAPDPEQGESLMRLEIQTM